MNAVSLAVAFSTFFLAARAGAQAVEGAFWVEPIAQTFNHEGAKSLAGLGSPSLSALSALDAQSRLAFVAAPNALSPLAHELSAQGYDPESFAALPHDVKLAALSHAAAAAESHAAAIADEALAAAAKPLGVGNYMEVSEKTGRALDVSLYLPADRARAVAAAASAAAAFRAERQALIAEFERDLTGKIAEGRITADNLIGRDEGGWYAIDEHPDRRYPTVNALYNARLERLNKSPLGPWTDREATLFRRALRESSVYWAVDREFKTLSGGDAPPTRLHEMETNLFDVSIRALEIFRDAKSNMFKIVRRFNNGVPRNADFLALEDFWYSTLYSIRHDVEVGRTTRAWIHGTIRGGDNGLPSWDRLGNLKRKMIARYGRNMKFGAIFSAAGIAAIGFLHLGGLLALILFLAPFAWVVFNGMRQSNLVHFSAPTDMISEWLRH